MLSNVLCKYQSGDVRVIGQSRGADEATAVVLEHKTPFRPALIGSRYFFGGLEWNETAHAWEDQSQENQSS